ncbi:APC membrane recruitment protein 3 [Mixophyes fleayi]|uniref:APC membrane recruitment protein 3 n=1 Tax=Mixophyes fleayi TaxID=3061075 RepID=UPI003F4D79CE
MELIRGKTFIKSYAQSAPEKVQPAGGNGRKNAASERHISDCHIKMNGTRTQKLSNGICTSEADDNVRCSKVVRSRCKTNDFALRHDKPEKNIGQRAQSRLSNSLSSPGLVEDPGGKRNDVHTTRQPTCKQTMIDYRNFVPQMPFVPSVAKSLPKKRISLRRSKKSLKNIFNLKKNKQQDAISEDEKLQPTTLKLTEERTIDKEHHLDIAEMSSDDFLAPEFPDREMYIDAIDPFKAMCEDVTSLKSFDSFTGCGEIFADESSSFIDIENSRVMFISKPSLVAASFQGGVERLASPAKSESIDVSRLRGHINLSPINLCSNVLSESKSLPGPNDSIKKKTNDNISRDHVSNSSYSDLMSSSENINEAESPMSTSDEGYYDSYSTALEEDSKEPSTRRPFPRDSYSGDALYELFCDSSNTKLWSAQDCDLSVSGHNTDNSKSIYSFCVRSEENLISQPAIDLDEDGTLQSTWKGRECLLKLCDTELSLTIGMGNWLKNPGKIIESEINDKTYNPKEPVDDYQVSNGNTAVQTTTICRDSKDQITSQWESDQENNGPMGNHIKYSENILADISSSKNMEEPETSTINSCLCMPEDSYPFEAHSDNTVSIGKPPNLRTLGSIIETKHEIELSSPYRGAMVPTAFPYKLNGTDVLPPCNHFDTLQSLGLQYFKCSMSENDTCLVQLLERCTSQIASLHITFGTQSTLYNICKIMRPYEIAQNIKHSIAQHDSGTQAVPLQQALSSTSDTEINTKQLKTIKHSKYEYNSNYQCILKSLKEAQTSKVTSRPNFQTLFKSSCSSVISHCSSVLYRVHNLEDEIIFFNTRKNNQSLSSNDDLTQDSDASSTDFPKYRKDGFQSISPTTCIGESGLLIAKNKKWII